MKKRVVVIGGGAAGMAASIAAAERGAAVTLLEPNERLGKKLNITGKGRCNVTNDADLGTVLAHIPRNGRFLYSALTRCGPRDVMAFFEAQGVPLKVERGNRVFPVSDRAFDISAALERRLKALRVDIVRDRAVSVETRTADGGPAVTGVTGEQGRYPAECVILATGGVSYPATGSTGEGHRIARTLGHTVTPLTGSLVPLRERGNLCARMQGLSLRNVRLTAWEDAGKRGKEKRVYAEQGELLFTHFGVSGPLVLSASARMRRFDTCAYRLEVDLKPALDEAALDRRILVDFTKYANRDFQNALDDLLPQKLIPVMVEVSGIPARKKVHDLSREERRALLVLLKRFPIPIAGPRPVTEAIVTAGGVDVREVRPDTMESKLVGGLYFAGELLDVDAFTGGFNLQIAWSTGRAAGIAAASDDGT